MIKGVKKIFRKVKRFFHVFVFKNFSNLPLIIEIETTNFCNAKCWFCPNSHLQRKKEFMSDEIFNTIVRRLQEEKINVLEFVLHINGEPLLDKKLFDRINHLHNLFPSSPIKFTTNFSVASDDIIEKILCSPLKKITISINAIDSDEYYSIMKLPYDKTMKNIEKFMKRKEELHSPIAVDFSIVARADNMDAVEKFQEKYAKLGNVRVIRLGEWVNKGKPNAFDEKKKRRNFRICGELYSKICILSNGDYALCCFDAEGSVHMNVKETPLREVGFSPFFKKIRLHHFMHGRTNKECINCSTR